MTTGSSSLSKPALWKNVRALTWLLARLRSYWVLIKDLQTGLLLVTAAAGYVSGCCLNWNAASLFEVLACLFFAISGSTILNMLHDRDIDAAMQRTAHRPLPARKITPLETLVLGSVFSAAGVAWAFLLDVQFGLIVFTGLFFDLVVYTIWLKRRSPYSIIIGGISGGMPVLAARSLAVGEIETVGLLMATSVLLWIPTHIMTFNIKYAEDYRRAKIPTFPAAYGIPATRLVIAFSTLVSVAVMLWMGHLIGMLNANLWVLGGLGLVLVGLIITSMLRPSLKLNFILYKGASIYMLASMLLVIWGA